MAKKLYVGGLPYSTSDTELKDAFAQCGTVESAVIIMDKMSGRSKGFGFVEMDSDDEANAAIEKMNGFSMGGREINVSEARPQAPREGGGGRYRAVKSLFVPLRIRGRRWGNCELAYLD